MQSEEVCLTVLVYVTGRLYATAYALGEAKLLIWRRSPPSKLCYLVSLDALWWRSPRGLRTGNDEA
ncbi:MAG: hypothetical protein BGO23_04320 [Solirubrobacterales bacterium 67-14]|nr:MAG: hypothetical protein BGO23_04320 [Solirubrobacterales bacterium 67-14]